MRTAWHSLLIALLLAVTGAASNRIVISAQLDTAAHNITGWVTITWPALEFPTSDLQFRLYANARTDLPGAATAAAFSDSTFTTIDTLQCGEINLTDQCRVEKTNLYCPTDRVYVQGESLSVRLHFTTHIATLSRRMDRLFVSHGEYLLDGWFPIPAPRRAGEWMTVSYSELTELVADFFDLEVRFRAPESLRVIGAGLISTNTEGNSVTHSFSLSEAHDFALCLSPSLETRSYTHGPITINVHTSKRTAYVADSVAELCRLTLDTMGQWIALYPYPELHVLICELGFLGGIELPRMIVSSVPSAGQFLHTKDVVMIHEIVHQWFYGIINSDQATTPWMDEAVTDYFTERVSRALYGERNFLDWWGITLDYGSLQRLQGLPTFDRLPITLPAEKYFSMGTYAAAVYNKGAVTLRTLFRHLRPGDELSFWRRYYELCHLATPGESDFLSLLSEYEPYAGNDVASTILHNSDAIDYAIERIANEPMLSVSPSGDSSSQSTDVQPQYRCTIEYAMYNPIGLPATVRVTFADGTHRDTLLAPKQGQGRLIINNRQPLISAAIDPDGKIGLDRDMLNNSLSLHSNGAGLRLFSGLTFLVESLFSYVWGM